MSRQSDWQKKMRQENRCQICGEAEYVAGYCQRHYEKRMSRLRENVTGTKSCTYCGEEGHNRRGCQQRKMDEAAGIDTTDVYLKKQK